MPPRLTKTFMVIFLPHQIVVLLDTKYLYYIIIAAIDVVSQ